VKTLIATLALALAIPAFAQELVELRLPNSSKVVVKLMFRNGSICDPKGKEGLTFLTANLVAQGGTAEMSFAEIQDAIYPMAPAYYVTVDKEVTVFTFEVHRDWLKKFYPIMRGLILTPSFTESDFQRVKVNQQTYVDQVIRASSDEDYSKMALEDLLFRGTNYQHMKQGTSSGVKAITLEDVKKQYAEFFTRTNLMIGIAGGYDDAFLAMLRKDMATLPETKPMIPKPGAPRMPDGVVVEIVAKDDAFGSAIFTGAPLEITRASDDFAALMVANSYLGEHRKSYSKLYQEIRAARSMNYGDYSYIEWYEGGGGNMLPPPGVPRSSNYFSIWIRPVQIGEQLRQQYAELADIPIGHAHFALRMAFYELGELVKNGMTPEQFETTRTFLQSYIKLYVQTPSDRLGYLMDSRFYGRKDYIGELDGLLAKLTLADVNRAIKKYWSTKNMFVAIVTNTSEAEPLAKSLRENLPSPMSYSDLVKSGLPADVLARDATVEKLPLNVTSVKIVKSADTFR
jgi:zinc protease